MPSSSFFRPFISRAISSITTLSSSASTPPKFSTQNFIKQFLTLITSLSQNPSNPKTLTSLDSILIHSHLLDTTTSLLVVRSLSLTNKLTRSKLILSNLNRRNNLPTTFLYSVLLQCILRNGTIRDVATQWPEVDVPSIEISDFVIWACRRCENVPEIERIYWRISWSNWRVSSQCYVSLIGAMCRLSYPNLGRTILNEMIEKGYEADDLTYFALFQSFCRIGDVLEADSVLRDWRNRRDFELDILIYGNFFYGLCKSGKFREARKLFDKLTTRDHDSGCAANFEPVLKPGRRVIFQLTYPGAISEMMAFEAYFRALCSFGRVDDAEKLLKIAIKKRTIPEICIFSCFIKALFKANRSDDALRFFEAHRNKADIAFAVVIGLCDIGKVDDAREFLNESINEGSVPTARVWNRVIKSYWETGHEEKAVGLFKELRARNCNGESYSVMICKFLEKGKVEVAVSLLDEMVAKKFEAGVDLYSGIVKGLYKIGRFDESNKWLNQIVENGVLVSYDEWESLYDSLSMEDGAKFWKLIEENYKNFLRENERRRSKGK